MNAIIKAGTYTEGKPVVINRGKITQVLQEKAKPVHPAYSYQAGIIHEYLHVLEMINQGEFDNEPMTGNAERTMKRLFQQIKFMTQANFNETMHTFYQQAYEDGQNCMIDAMRATKGVYNPTIERVKQNAVKVAEWHDAMVKVM